MTGSEILDSLVKLKYSTDSMKDRPNFQWKTWAEKNFRSQILEEPT
jgi:hypothetical protein